MTPRQRLLLALAAALTALALLAPPAIAADPVYTHYACRLPDGSPAPTADLSYEATGSVQVEDACARGAGLILRAAHEGASGDAKWIYRPPVDTSLAGLRVSRVINNVSGAEMANRIWTLMLDDEVLDVCSMQQPCEASDTVESTLTGDKIEMRLMCFGNPCRGPAPGDGTVSIESVAVTLRDTSAPVLQGRPEGDLFSGPVSGIRNVTFTASDVGGGVFRAHTVVDGIPSEPVTVDDNQGACRKPFRSGKPCPSTVSGSISIDTSQLADGNHTMKVVVTDPTEVNVTESEPLSFTVEHGTSGAEGTHSTGSAVSASAIDLPRVSGRAFRRGGIQQSWSRARKVRGRLTTAAGAPVAGTRLTVFSTAITPGAASRRIGEVITDATGTFIFVVPAGPSRTLSFVASGIPLPVARLVVRVPAPVRLIASRDRLMNGQKLFLTAYLLGGNPPSRSADVAFQVRIGDQWRTFATRPLDKSGRARIAHRFRVTYQRLTYRFRAIVVRRKAFPFANSASPAVAVQVN